MVYWCISFQISEIGSFQHAVKIDSFLSDRREGWERVFHIYFMVIAEINEMKGKWIFLDTTIVEIKKGWK